MALLPQRHAITPHAANTRNPHGTSFDYWGYCYANDGTGGKSYQVRPEGNGFKMHILLRKESRPVAANAILSSAHFPEELQDDFLICNTIGFSGVKQYDLDRDGDGGRTREAAQVWGTPGLELLNSDDRNFRPTDAIMGEDGALYVADWHNAIIGYMQHNIRDPNRDHVHGRIFRLTVKDRPLQKPVKIHGQPIEALLDHLKHPVNGVRHRTRVELSARDSDAVVRATQKWMKDFDPNDETEAHHRIRFGGTRTGPTGRLSGSVDGELNGNREYRALTVDFKSERDPMPRSLEIGRHRNVRVTETPRIQGNR